MWVCLPMDSRLCSFKASRLAFKDCWYWPWSPWRVSARVSAWKQVRYPPSPWPLMQPPVSSVSVTRFPVTECVSPIYVSSGISILVINPTAQKHDYMTHSFITWNTNYFSLFAAEVTAASDYQSTGEPMTLTKSFGKSKIALSLSSDTFRLTRDIWSHMKLLENDTNKFRVICQFES